MAVHHGRRTKSDKNNLIEEEEEEDPYDLRIKNTGCAEFHHALQVILSILVAKIVLFSNCHYCA